MVAMTDEGSSSSKEVVFSNASDYHHTSGIQFKQGRRLAMLLRCTLPEDFAPRYIADLGCGSGRYTELVAGLFPDARLVAADCSPAMLALAEQVLKGERYSFVECDLETADLGSLLGTEKYDLVTSNAVLHWIHDHRRLYCEIHRILTPGGWVAIHQGGKGCYRELVELAESLLRESGLWGKYFEGFVNPIKYITGEELADIVEAAGFRIADLHMVLSHVYPETLAADFAQSALLPYSHRIEDTAEREAFERRFISRARMVDRVTINRLYFIGQKP